MVKIQLKCIIRLITIFLAFAGYCNCQLDNPCASSSSWAKLEISPNTLSSIKYGNFRIAIYEHVNNQKATATSNQKKYFYSPLALLDHTSAVSIYNRVTKKSEMRFRVEMWNDKVENEIFKYLNEIVGHEIKSNQVAIIPLEKVILTSKGLTPDYSLSPEWTNYDNSKTLRLSVTCYDQKFCDELADEMRSFPEQFDHLNLLYSLSSQTSQTKQTTISIDSVTSGSMVSNLLQKFGNKKEIFLTANDEKKMLTEIATNIRMDTFDDSEVASPDMAFQIYNILKDLLITPRTTIKEQSDKMWDSVFWNDDNYRPDKTTKTLNEIIDELDTETQKKLVDMFEKAERESETVEKLTSSNKDVEKRQRRYDNQTKNTNANSWTDVDRLSSHISEKMINDSNNSHPFTILKENVKKLLLESKNHIQWDGVKFIPKPMTLSKINLSKFSDSHSFQDRNVRVRYTNADLSVPIKFMQHAELSVVNEWINLKDELQATTELLNTTVLDLVKTREELGSVKRDLTNKFEETKQELEKTKIDLEKTKVNVIVLSTKLNTTEEKMKTKTENLSTELKANSKRLGQEIIVAEENLKKELRNTSELFNITVKSLVKTNAELSNAKRDLTTKLEGTKQELDKTKIDLEKTKVNVNYLSVKLNATEKEWTEMKIRAGNLSIEIKTNSLRLGHEIKVADDNLKKELRANLNRLETATTNWTSTRTELSSTKSIIADLTAKLNNRTREIVDIGRMPTSCLDLERMGHKLSGFFSVKGSKKIEIVYCDFYPNQNDKQKWIGYADVKSEPVHFYVQRNSSFKTKGTPIPFNLARMNEGNAMNLASGIFTAPRPGIYFFSFTGLAQFPDSSSRLYLGVGLFLNEGYIGLAEVDEAKTVAGQFSPLTIQSTLNLKKGDQVRLEIVHIQTEVYLFDDIGHRTHFTGFMLEEEIVAAL